ncbi:MAG: hypothetical protein ACFBSD_13115 [Paracoccaceae bacterium]
MRFALIAAAVLSTTVLSATVATADSDDHLLDFGWLSEEQHARIEAAHTALEEAEAEMCATMVAIYAEHSARVHGDHAELPEEEAGFIERRCVAEAFAAHIQQSIAIHDAIHAEIHSSGHHHD